MGAACTSKQSRILIAGDKSHAGKSTVSLGLLGALLEAGISASDIAYIKPATQCVSSTLIARFCETMGIAYEHVGPLVFYRGHTRHLLDEQLNASNSTNDANVDGIHNTAAPAGSNQLVLQCAAAVERISRGKRVTLIDGVGYPSVGSIVGCSSADIAVACRAPVLLVGKAGVGDAIDSFNLCACFFEARRVPVLGAIFNKLSPSGFYGIRMCGEYVRKYMRAARPRQRVYGLLPASEALGGLAPEETCGIAFTHSEVRPSAGLLTDDDKKAVAVVTELFREHVDVEAFLADLEHATVRPSQWARHEELYPIDG